MGMPKTERKYLIIKIQTYLRSGILTNNKEQIVEAYRWIEDLLNDHGVYTLDDSLPQFPESERG